MKILAVADEECPALWEHYTSGRLADYDLILSCGDLKAKYLSFLVTMGRAPLLYVHGNHDEAYKTGPPQGCICIEDTIYEYQGVRFLGLGGSARYRPDGTYMYTEREMGRRIRRLKPALFRKGGFDVLVTHAAARGCDDLDTTAHKGFEGFVKLMDQYHPSYMIHGHIHKNYGYRIEKVSGYRETRIINAVPSFILDYQ